MNENNIIEQIKNKINIVYLISEFIPLQKKGKNYVGLCPFHADSNPSMFVSEEKQIFNCFSCNVGGNAISFLSKFKKISYKSAIEELAKKLNIEYKTTQFKPIYSSLIQEQIDVMNVASLFFENELYTENGKHALNYLNERKIENSLILHHKIGFSNENLLKYLKEKHDMSNIIAVGLVNEKGHPTFINRLMFPIRNIYGDVIAFSGRRLSDDKQKYINSIESKLFSKSKTLYNFYNAKEEIHFKKEVIITEGFFDVIALEQINVKNVVAIMGTALTKEHLKLLKNNKIILMLDSDEAGINSMLKSIVLLLKNSFIVDIVYNKEQKDPKEFLREYGKNALEELLKNRKDGFLYLINWYKNTKNISNIEKLSKILKDISKLIPRKNKITFQIYKGKISKLFNVDMKTIDYIFDHHFSLGINNKSSQNISEKPNDNHIEKKYKHMNWADIFTWCLLNNKEYAKLYLDSKPIITDESIYKYNEIANLQKENHTKKIKEIKQKFIEDKKLYNLEKKYSKNEFIDIMEKLSYKSLIILEQKVLEELQATANLNHKNKSQKLMLKLKQIRNKKHQIIGRK